jgi:hypothetical protein
MGDGIFSCKNVATIIFFGLLVIFGILSIVASFIQIADPDADILKCE